MVFFLRHGMFADEEQSSEWVLGSAGCVSGIFAPIRGMQASQRIMFGNASERRHPAVVQVTLHK